MNDEDLKQIYIATRLADAARNQAQAIADAAARGDVVIMGHLFHEKDCPPGEMACIGCGARVKDISPMPTRLEDWWIEGPYVCDGRKANPS